jgi:hypothetical protein
LIKFPVDLLDILTFFERRIQLNNYVINFAATLPLYWPERPLHSPLMHILSVALLNHAFLSLFAE